MRQLAGKFTVVLITLVVAAGLIAARPEALSALTNAIGQTLGSQQAQDTLSDLGDTGRTILSDGSKVIGDFAQTIAGSSGQTGTVSGGDLAFDVDEVTTALNGLAVHADDNGSDYDREGQFGTAWLDVDGNGCDTRNDILARDLSNVVKDGSCTVTSGTLDDPYTNTTINFVRGRSTSTAVQIDHLVALKNAWQSGARNLTQEQRQQLANDPLNLMAVDGPTNGAKSDSDASEWLPPNQSFQCQYVERQVMVKAKYGLWVTAAEKSAIAGVLATCQS